MPPKRGETRSPPFTRPTSCKEIEIFPLPFLAHILDTFPDPLSYYRKLGDGLFLQSCAEVAQLYPKVQYENIIIDNCCMQVYSASQFTLLIFCLGCSFTVCLFSCVISVLLCCSWSRIHTSLMCWLCPTSTVTLLITWQQGWLEERELFLGKATAQSMLCLRLWVFTDRLFHICLYS